MWGMAGEELSDRAGEGMEAGIPPPTPQSFCIWGIQNMRSGE